MTRITRKIVSAPVAVLSAAVLVLSGSGLALAAAQGSLDVPFAGDDNVSEQTPEAPAEGDADLDEAADDDADPTAEPEETAAAAPSPSLAGLCKAYQAGSAAFDKERVNPAFSALLTAAGGAENVATYCVDLVGESRKPEHPTKPEGAGKPEGVGKPEGAGKPEGTGKPEGAGKPSTTP